MKEIIGTFCFPIKQVTNSGILLEMGSIAQIEIPLGKDRPKLYIGDIVKITFNIPVRE